MYYKDKNIKTIRFNRRGNNGANDILKNSPHSQTHLQFAQAIAKTKNCKRVCLFANAFLPTRKNKIGIVLN